MDQVTLDESTTMSVGICLKTVYVATTSQLKRGERHFNEHNM